MTTTQASTKLTIPTEDRLELAELAAKYGFYADTFQIEPFMELWTEDACFDETPIGAGLCEGADAIRAYFENTIFVTMSGMAHITGGTIITAFSGDEARGVCSVVADGDVRSGGTIHATCYYDDVYARDADGWKFRSRTVYPYCAPDLNAFFPTEAS